MHCRVCRRPLTITQRIRGLCDDPECRRRDVPYQQARRVESIGREIRRRVGAAPALAGRPILLLPDGVTALAPLAPDRRAAIAARLQQLIEAGGCAREPTRAPAKPFAHGLPALDFTLPVVANACALCGGRCCHSGGDHAWLDAPTLRRVAADLGVPPPAVIAAYLEHLPDRSHQGSCVYHGATGCHLPRAMRSDTCNAFYCDSLATFVRGWRAAAGECIVAACGGADPRRLAAVDGDEWKALDAQKRSPE